MITTKTPDESTAMYPTEIRIAVERAEEASRVWTDLRDKVQAAVMAYVRRELPGFAWVEPQYGDGASTTIGGFTVRIRMDRGREGLWQAEADHPDRHNMPDAYGDTPALAMAALPAVLRGAIRPTWIDPMFGIIATLEQVIPATGDSADTGVDVG